MKGIAPIVSIALLLIAFIGVSYYVTGGFANIPFSVPGQVTPTQCQDPGTARTITVNGIDKYNPGTAVTDFAFASRKKGETTWNYATASTFSASPGAIYELALGLNATTATTAESQTIEGPVVEYKVPCDAASSVDYQATNDALGTDLVAQAIDPNDGNVISVTDPVDIDNGGPVSIAIDWYSSFEENFGSEACGSMSNICVVRVNTTAFEEDETELQYNGVKLTETTVPVVVSSTSGMKDVAFKCPVLKSTAGQGSYPFTLVVDPDDTINPDGHDDDNNVTITMYDSHVFLDGDTNIPTCGVEDETGAEIGAAAADTLEIFITGGS